MPYKCEKCGYLMTYDVYNPKWKPKRCPRCHSRNNFKEVK